MKMQRFPKLHFRREKSILQRIYIFGTKFKIAIKKYFWREIQNCSEKIFLAQKFKVWIKKNLE